MDTILTIGHGTLTTTEFLALLKGAEVASLVDIRRYPGSRRHPWFGAGEMARWLPETGIAYRRIESLGGRRRPSSHSPNTAWRNEQFAAYADHMATDEFAAGIAELTSAARAANSADNDQADPSVNTTRADSTGPPRTAIMCSESLWWRCHRRLVADHLMLIEHIGVQHLFHDRRLAAHVPTAEARIVGRHLEYPASTSAA
ncbi:MAG: DUF488 domain-containing protein [Microthrixaceae bacterium]|nr:DUF488 domain-containing protein [Microthrixaceae bacterium]